ncbi:MAG TPA: hypothetical protein VGC24_08890, partial [Burkholderiaceae bacterium]
TTSATPTPTVVLGQPASYTVTVANAGPDADTVDLAHTAPAGLDPATVQWTCAATGGATCPAASGTGPIAASAVALPAGASLVYTVTGTTTALGTLSGPITTTSVLNPATVSTPSAAINVVAVVGPPTSLTPVPALSGWLLALLSAAVAGLGLARLGRTQKRMR